VSTPVTVILIVAGAIVVSSLLKRVWMSGYQLGVSVGYDLGLVDGAKQSDETFHREVEALLREEES